METIEVVLELVGVFLSVVVALLEAG